MTGNRLGKLLGITLVILLIVTTLVTACTKPAPAPTSAAPSTGAKPPASTAAPTTSAVSAPKTTSAPTTTSPAGGPVKGGILKISFVRPPVGFGYPPTLTGPDNQYSRPFFERLLKLDEKNTYQPELASSWEIAPDGKSITFKLRQGVKFHDGTAFNADAVKFNYDPLVPPKSAMLTGISSIDKVDDYTVKFNLPNYNNLVMFSLAVDNRLGIVSPAAIQKNGKDWARTNPVGTGPFTLKAFERNVSITCARNPNYWNNNLPYVDEVKFIAIPDPMTQMAAFKAGEINVMFDARIQIADQLAKEGYQVNNFVATLQAYCFDTNHADSVFAKQKVREALEYAVDKEAIMNGPMLGYYKSAYQTVLTGSPEYNPDCPPRKYDPAKAKQLLAEAGYANGFSFKYFINETEFQEPPTMVQSYLSKVGVKMEIVKMAPAAFEALKNGGNLEKNSAAHMVLEARPTNPLFMLNAFLRSDSPYYVNTVKPAGLDALLDQAMAARDEQAKIKIVQQISKAVYDNASYIPMQVQCRLIIVDKHAQDVGFCIGGDCNNNLWGHMAWLKP